ncbi:MAG: PDZ domain-containing protein, partial [Proteobacteria bacterium]|nr:PDZ domain-containing protein [Pseudomonadota bacterium]
MNVKRLIYWGFAAACVVAGISLSIVDKDGHYELTWQGTELMAKPKPDEYHDLASLQVFNRVLLQLQENYVDPARFDPSLMLATSLDALQKNVPELLLVFDRKVKEKPTSVVVNIAGQSKTFSLENIDNLWEMSLRYKSILQFIQDYLPKDVKQSDLEYTAINGILSTLDPHSLILSPETYRSMAEGNRGKFGGLGIVVRMIDGVLIIVEPVEGDVPALKAGLKEGDQILSIDGTPTLNMGIQEAVNLLKGEPDTTVHLSVMRKGWKTPKNIDVVRAEIEIPSLESDQLGDHIAYIKLKSFQGNTQSEMLKALAKLKKDMGDIEGLVLDLRGNPGGLLDQAVLVADNFLPKDSNIVTTVGVNEKFKKPRNASGESQQPNYPIIVLMDSSSASASEIVAGALKNNNRALIVGDKSFGKGSVQVLYELPDKSALKLTIGQYLTPGNQSIQSVGIVPDIQLVPMRALSGDDIDLYPKLWQRREETLGSHLDNQKATKNQKTAYNLRYLSKRYTLPEDELEDDSVITLEDIDKIIKTKQKTSKPVEDPQVRLAKAILSKTGTAYERKAMIKKFVAQADSLQDEEDQALVEALDKLGIDWQKCGSPQNPKLDLKIETDKPNNTIDAGASIVIRATATNNGTETVCRVAGRTESTLGRTNDREFIFGKIEPGTSVTREMTIKTNHAQSSRVDDFIMKLYLDDGSPVPENSLAENTIYLTTVSQPLPAFAIHYTLLDKDGKTIHPGNGLLDDDEEITMHIQVTNEGRGTAKKPLIFIKNNASEIQLIDARAETDPLETGASLTRDFKFKTTKVSAADVQIELHVYDKSSTHTLVEKIAIQTARSEHVEDASVKLAKGTRHVLETTPMRVSPVKIANSLIDVPKDTIVNVDAEANGYAHIQAGPVTGWLPLDVLEPSKLAASSLTPKAIATIPRITLADMAHETDKETFTVEADVTAFAPLRDYYIYAGTEIDHTYNVEKVAYTPLETKTGH